MINIDGKENNVYEEMLKIKTYLEQKGIEIKMIDKDDFDAYIDRCYKEYTGMTFMVNRNKWIACMSPGYLEPTCLWTTHCSVIDIKTKDINFSVAFFKYGNTEIPLNIDRSVETLEELAEELMKA